MRIVVNGEEREAKDAVSIVELLAELNIRPEVVAVELNQDVVNRTKFPEVCLKSGDAVEIVHMVGGGAELVTGNQELGTREELERAAVQRKFVRLQEILRTLGRVAIAFSGGVDSTLLAKVAYDVLGDNALAVTAISPSLAEEEEKEARELLRMIGVPHRFVETHELEDPRYTKNPQNRCYYCKTELFSVVETIAQEEKIPYILYGEIVDDALDYRPGSQAAKEFSVRAPLAEAGLTKIEIRSLSKQLGLPTWDKPAQPCLSSRVPHGTEITPAILHQIDQAEAALHRLGFREVRVRHHGEVARIELPPEEIPDFLEDELLRERVSQELRKAGYLFVTVDLEGYRRGSSNQFREQSQAEFSLSGGKHQNRGGPE